MDKDEHEIHPENDETPDESLPVTPVSDDDFLAGGLGDFSAVADEAVQAVDALYGGIPPGAEYADDYADNDLYPLAAEADDDESEYADDEDEAVGIEQERAPEREFVLPAFETSLPMPPMTRLRRGSLGSLVPALLLIGIGAWLTLTTTAGTPPDPRLIALLAVGGVVIALLAQWLGSGRWSRGGFFFAVATLLIAGVLVFSTQPSSFTLVLGWPLLVIALGVAFALSGVLARPANRRLVTPGILLIVAGLLSVIINNDVLPQRFLTTAAVWSPAVLVLLVVIWLLPVVFRRRG